MTIRYIFSINTGRAGSDYLTELLSKAENTVSFHEPMPVMMGQPMQQFNAGDESALRALMPLKLQEIQKSRSKGDKIYCETNHTFIKGWGYLIPENIAQEEIGVIILRRDIGKIIHSMLRVRDVPGLTNHANAWYPNPGAERNLSPLPPQAGPYKRCEWYIWEVFLRASDFQKRFPQITYWDCDLEQLNDYSFVERMFTQFGLIPTSELKQAVGKRLNVPLEWPKRSLKDLLADPGFQRADDLPPAERDHLLQEMIAYMRQHKADRITAWEPNPAKNDSFYDEAIQLVADSEPELERHFQVTLKFTDMEFTLALELLRLINPHDLASTVYIRTTEPAITYTLDLNYTLTLRNVIQRAGIVASLRVIWLLITGRWQGGAAHKMDKTEADSV